MELSAQSTVLGGAVFATQLILEQFKPPNTIHQCNGRQWFLVAKWETCYLGVEYWDYSWLRVKDEFQDNEPNIQQRGGGVESCAAILNVKFEITPPPLLWVGQH